ncbi:MAG: hypothetical protein A2046_01760 [Bacteroidetes bacterium GWA2_30_7]|nr:MAG: hypothetical protein A2046_01760 [Bacteroidetes bacterium GWA2_30_7]
MKYYITKKVSLSFDEAVQKVTENLSKEGFGIITEINVKETMKKKLDIDFRNYRILGACNPNFAHQALTVEDKIGVMLPCNVIVQQHDNGEIEVSSINPAVSMQSVANPNLNELAQKVVSALTRVIEAL